MSQYYYGKSSNYIVITLSLVTIPIPFLQKYVIVKMSQRKLIKNQQQRWLGVMMQSCTRRHNKTSLAAARESTVMCLKAGNTNKSKNVVVLWLCVMCRKRDVQKDQFLKSVFAGQSAVFCTVEIRELLIFLLLDQNGLCKRPQCCMSACQQTANIHSCCLDGGDISSFFNILLQSTEELLLLFFN